MVREIYRATSEGKCSIAFDPYELYEAAIPVRDDIQEAPAPYVQDGPVSYIQEGPTPYPWDSTQVFDAINSRLRDEHNRLPMQPKESYEGPLTTQDKQDAIQPLHNKLLISSGGWAAPLWWFQELWFVRYYNQRKSYRWVLCAARVYICL